MLATVAIDAAFAGEEQSATDLAPVVPTSEGNVQGQAMDGVAVFKGLPYAAPPVGDLRWRAAQRALPRQGLLQARKFGASCIQKEIPGATASSQSENCLTLNVWSPGGTGQSAPVMVWIHGGAFRFGSGAQRYYDGTEFAKSGVVLVTLNYRLGRFGFFSHPALESQMETANFALSDQIQALKWIQENISAFGGDPENVTIFGESAGAVSIGYHLTMDASRGLFHKAIMQSGGGWQIPSRLLNKRGRRLSLREEGVKWAERHNLNQASSARELRAVSSEDVLEPGSSQGGMGAINPVIDNILIHDDIASRFADGKAASVPLIAGSNSFEGSLLASFKVKPGFILYALGRRKAEARQLYQTSERSISNTEFAYELFADATFAGPARDLAKMTMAQGQKAYVYYFDYRKTTGTAVSDGAKHGWEIPFVFNSLDAAPAILTNDNDHAQLLRLANDMHQYWVNFASTGSPENGNSIQWPAFTQEDGEYTLNATNGQIKIVKNFRVPRLTFQKELYLKRLSKAH